MQAVHRRVLYKICKKCISHARGRLQLISRAVVLILVLNLVHDMRHARAVASKLLNLRNLVPPDARMYVAHRVGSRDVAADSEYADISRCHHKQPRTPYARAEPKKSFESYHVHRMVAS